MSAVDDKIRAYFEDGGHMLVGQAAPPDRIDIKHQGHARVVGLRYGPQTRRAVVKPIAPTSALRDANMLFHAQYRMRAADPLLHQTLNQMLAPVPEHQWVVLEYVEGPSLLKILRRSLWQSWRGDLYPAVLLKEAARALAAINRLSAVDARLPLPAQANSSYIESMMRSWSDPCVQAILPPTWRGGPPARLATDAFRRRTADRVFLVDCQPKNILVPRRGQVRLIDQDYGVGNPALSLACFLVTLDRLVLRHPLPTQRARIAAWKAIVLESYFQHADAWIADDLAFFYPWTLVRNLCQHYHRRPLLRPYVQWVYGRCLCEFLARYEQSSAGTLGPVEPVRMAA